MGSILMLSTYTHLNLASCSMTSARHTKFLHQFLISQTQILCHNFWLSTVYSSWAFWIRWWTFGLHNTLPKNYSAILSSRSWGYSTGLVIGRRSIDVSSRFTVVHQTCWTVKWIQQLLSNHQVEERDTALIVFFCLLLLLLLLLWVT
jgi:hypothetical protein